MDVEAMVTERTVRAEAAARSRLPARVVERIDRDRAAGVEKHQAKCDAWDASGGTASWRDIDDAVPPCEAWPLLPLTAQARESEASARAALPVAAVTRIDADIVAGTPGPEVVANALRVAVAESGHGRSVSPPFAPPRYGEGIGAAWAILWASGLMTHDRQAERSREFDEEQERMRELAKPAKG